MAGTMPPRRRTKPGNRLKILAEIQAPLGFYVLALLIIETTLAIVLTAAGFEQNYKWYGFLLMILVFAAVVLTVASLISPGICVTVDHWLVVPLELIFRKLYGLPPLLALT